MKRAISKNGQMLIGGACKKGEFLLINMMPCKWQQAWDNFTIFSIVELRIKYCNLISRKHCDCFGRTMFPSNPEF